MKINWNKRYTTIAVYVVIVFIVCYLIYKVTNNFDSTSESIVGILRLLSPFLYALLIAYFINPLMVSIEKWILKGIHMNKLKRALSITLSYIIIFSVVIILLSFILPQLYSSIQEIGGILTEYNAFFQDMLHQNEIPIFKTDYYIDMSIVNQYLNENIESTLASATDIVQNMAPKLLVYVTKLASGLLNLIVGFIIAIYLLLNKEKSLMNSRKIIFALFPAKQAKNILNLSKESNYIFINFIIGKLLDSLIVGIICFIVLLILGIPYALLLSVLVGITNIIPYFGPFIGGIIGFILLLFINPIQALWFIVFIIILQQVDGNILGPKILGDSTGLSPVWVIFAIIIFGKLFGFAGMFLGVPVMAVIKNIISRQIDILYTKKMTPM